MQAAAGDSACLETDVDDVLRLDELSELSLLCTLRTRFQRRQCFTWAGSILVFLNPWAWVPEAYDAEAEALHRSRRIGAGGSMPAPPPPPPPPHLFAVAEAALAALLRDGRSQHIVIGGESGAGKTESSKLVLGQSAAARRGRHAAVGGSGGGGAAAALQRLRCRRVRCSRRLATRRRCATTTPPLRQDAPARIDRSAGRVCGGTPSSITERTRPKRRAGERNFHALHYLLARPRAPARR